MFNKKALTYEQMEKQPKDKKFKNNSYEEVKKLVNNEDNNNIVNDVKKNKENTYKFKLFD